MFYEVLSSYFQTYEGAFHSGYGQEGHAAYTFCAVSSLVMMGAFRDSLSDVQVNNRFSFL